MAARIQDSVEVDVRPEQYVGEQLRNYRTGAGYTLEDLARWCEVTVGYLSRVENGHTRLSAEQLERICRYLQIPAPTTQKLFQALRQLPPSVVEHFLKNPQTWVHLS